MPGSIARIGQAEECGKSQVEFYRCFKYL